MPKKIDLTGQRFGRLIVLKEAPSIIYESGAIVTKWICVCDCGKTIETYTNALRRKRTKSCGCYQVDYQRKLNTKHKLCKHPLYGIYIAMKQRCYNIKNEAYKNYGARNIKVCDEWRNSFKSFYDWCIENGYKKGLEIDRRENDLGYNPDNCRFVTHRKNNLNKRLLKSNNTSGYEGVHWVKSRNKWRSVIQIKTKTHSLGSYIIKEYAVKARNNYIIENNLEHEYKIQEWYG